MARIFELDNQDGLVYYGSSDLLAQIADTLQRCPDSCFAKNTLAYYNSLYSELSDPIDCSYQVEINQELCPKAVIESFDEGLGLLLDFVEGLPRRTANRVLRTLLNEAIRQVTLDSSQEV